VTIGIEDHPDAREQLGNETFCRKDRIFRSFESSGLSAWNALKFRHGVPSWIANRIAARKTPELGHA
jgi:hypothetical protein